jgi:hypothetical protein
MYDLQFIPESHTYLVDGIIRPSVSQILQTTGISDISGIPPEVLEKARMFGSSVHKFCELSDKGELEQYEVQPEVMPCLMAWETFKSENKVEIVEVEKAYYCALGYCGTIDRLAKVDGKLTVIDIKTSSTVQKSAAIQLAAYALFFDQDDAGMYPSRMVVHLTQEGDYKILNGTKNGRQRKAFMSDDDFGVWAKVLDVYYFNRKRPE